MPSHWTLLIIVLLAVGCGMQQDAEAPITSMIDSAGVSIVTHGPTVRHEAPRWIPSDSASVVIGGLDDRPGYALYEVQTASFLSDSSILVVNGGTQELRVYDASGRLTNTIGGGGAGPGEFQALRWAAEVQPGRIAAWDVYGSRLTWFDFAGEVLETVTPTALEQQGLLLTLVAVLADGRVVMKDRPTDRRLKSESSGLRRDPIWHRWFTAAGTETESMRLPGPEGWFENSGQTWGTTPLVFGRRTIAAGVRNELVIGINDTFELRMYRAPNEVVRIVRFDEPLEPVSDELVRGARNHRADSIRAIPRSGGLADGIPFEERMEPWPLAQVASVPARETVPPFGALVGDQSGRVWMADYRLPNADSLRWTVLDSHGSVVAVARVPATWELLDAHRQEVLVLTRDHLDRESIIVVPMVLEPQ